MSVIMDHDYFWKYIQQDFGEIHVHLQNILRIQNLCNRSITRLTREAIIVMQNDMRDMADHLTENWQKATGSKGTALREIYGPRWEKNPKGFTFLEGEILCLLGLADYVQKRSIEPFLKFSKPHSTHSAPARTPVSERQLQTVTMEEERAELFVSNLITKIKGVYLSQNIVDPDFDRFLEKLDNLEVQWLPTSDNQLRATVVCPVCVSEGNDRRITLKVDTQGRWHVWSFTRHCDTFHYALPRGTKRKQYLEIGEMDDVMDDSVSDTTNLDANVKVEDEVVSNSALA